MTFSSTDHNTVAWGSGTITLLDGTTYSIGAGNTGNISAVTYIYLDIGTSTTALQTSTTASDAVGSGKILVAVAEDVASGKKALFTVFGGSALGGQGKLVTAYDIAANTITANEIAANTITANEIAANTITATEIAANTITSSEITTGEFITLSAQIKDAIITDAKIDSVLSATIVVSGATKLSDWRHSSDNTKIDGGDIYANSITATQIAASTITATEMNVSTLSAIAADLGTITAGTITGATVRTAASGARVQLTTANYIEAYDASNLRLKLNTTSLEFYDSSGVKRATLGGGGSYNELHIDTDIIYFDSIGSVFTLSMAVDDIIEWKAATNIFHFYYNSSLGGWVFDDSTGSGIVMPADDDAYDLGTASKQWKDLYVDGIAYLDAVANITYIDFFASSAPGSPTAGTVYYDSTANKLKVYNGSAWETVTSS